MSDDEKKETLQGNFVESVPFPTFYTNNIQINHSLFDFSFLVMDRLDQESFTIRARVLMSPTHAKALLNTLQIQVTKYEQRFGELALPKKREATDDATAPEQPPSQFPAAES